MALCSTRLGIVHMKKLLVLCLVFGVIVGCMSTIKFQDYTGPDPAIVTLKMPVTSSYKTRPAVIYESDVLSSEKGTLDCINEHKKIWRHTKMLGTWWDVEDLFELDLLFQPHKPVYIKMENFRTDTYSYQTCSLAFKLNPVESAKYRVELKGLYPSCDLHVFEYAGDEYKEISPEYIPMDCG